MTHYIGNDRAFNTTPEVYELRRQLAERDERIRTLEKRTAEQDALLLEIGERTALIKASGMGGIAAEIHDKITSYAVGRMLEMEPAEVGWPWRPAG